MLRNRLQVLLDDERAERLAREADRRGVAVAVLVREAIDQAFPSAVATRRRAASVILGADPMPVPDVAELRRELDGARGRS